MAAVPPITEAAFQQRIIDYSRLTGWMCMHTRPAKTEKGWRTPLQGDAGFVDLVLARRSMVWFFEVKSETGRTADAQTKWMAALGPRARVVRPSDWDWIQEVLR